MSFGNFLFGSAPQNRQVSQFTSGQEDFLTNLLQRLTSGEGGFGFDEDSFQSSFVDPALRQFQNRIAPQIQQQFIGSGFSQGSSLENALTRAGADVQGGLDQQRAQLLNAALNRQLQGTQTALGARQFGIEQDPGNEGFSSFALPVLGATAGGFFGGPAGAQLGAGLGSAGATALNRGFRR